MTALPIDMNATHLLRLLFLSSTALPIGAYCYSQGVETAIENGLIDNEDTALAYFLDVVELVLIRFELPMLAKLIQAFSNDSNEAFLILAAQYRASRESREFLAETQQMAFSLKAWAKEVAQQPIIIEPAWGFLPVYAALTASLQLPLEECLTAYAFAMLENQVLSAIKTVPLGQMAGQRVLWSIQQQLPVAVKNAMHIATSPQLLSNALPGLAMMSIQHEDQYSRLFRS